MRGLVTYEDSDERVVLEIFQVVSSPLGSERRQGGGGLQRQ